MMPVTRPSHERFYLAVCAAYVRILASAIEEGRPVTHLAVLADHYMAKANGTA